MSNNTLNEKQLSNYELVCNYLDIIFLAPSTVNLLKTDTTFQEVIEKDVNLVSYYETNFDIAEKKANKFIQAFHVITKKHIKISDNYLDYKDEDNNFDSINYTNVYLNNLLGQSVTQIGDSLKAKAPNEAEVKDEKVESKEPTEEDYANNTPQSDEEVLERSGYTMHDVADQLIQQQAGLLLNRNIQTGKVYAFNSKPKVIPIMKWLTASFMIIILILSIAAFAIMMCTNNKLQLPVQSWNGNGPSQITMQYVQLMTPFPFQLLMILLIVIMVVMSMLRNMKNDNSKYRYSWGWMIFYILMILMVTLIASGIQNSLIFNFNGFQSLLVSTQYGTNANIALNGSNMSNVVVMGQHLTKHAAYYYNLILDWRDIQFTIYALIGAIIVCTITGAVFNPKRDIQRLQALLLEYANEIRNGQIDSSDLGGSSPFGPFGGMLF